MKTSTKTEELKRALTLVHKLYEHNFVNLVEAAEKNIVNKVALYVEETLTKKETQLRKELGMFTEDPCIGRFCIPYDQNKEQGCIHFVESTNWCSLFEVHMKRKFRKTSMHY